MGKNQKLQFDITLNEKILTKLRKKTIKNISDKNNLIRIFSTDSYCSSGLVNEQPCLDCIFFDLRLAVIRELPGRPNIFITQIGHVVDAY